MPHAEQNALLATGQAVFLGPNRGLVFGSGQAISVNPKGGYIAGSDSRRENGALVY